MAQDISTQLEESYRFPNLFQVHLKIKTSEMRAKWRSALRAILPSSVGGKGTRRAFITNNLETAKSDFAKQNWAFVQNMWDSDFYDDLLSHWPADRFFQTIKYVTKAYDTGLIWNPETNSPPEEISHFPAVSAAYKYLSSDEFCKRITQLSGDGISRKCYQIRLTRAYWGSNVIPHIDSANDPDRINMIFFIDGSDGGLGIWEDNEYKSPIFVPTNLKNTCLFYDMSKGFYHGFPPMRFGSYRWTINAAYSS